MPWEHLKISLTNSKKKGQFSELNTAYRNVANFKTVEWWQTHKQKKKQFQAKKQVSHAVFAKTLMKYVCFDRLTSTVQKNLNILNFFSVIYDSQLVS